MASSAMQPAPALKIAAYNLFHPIGKDTWKYILCLESKFDFPQLAFHSGMEKHPVTAIVILKKPLNHNRLVKINWVSGSTLSSWL